MRTILAAWVATIAALAQAPPQPEPESEQETITVYATRNDVRVQDSPTHIEVLQREEIEEKMMMTPGDIVMTLNEMGGMRVQTTSPSLGAATIRMQGMRGRYTKFLADGLPLFGNQGAGLGLLQIPPMDLGQIEVIKGTASAFYGSGAMAGVVNLISRRPESEPAGEFLLNQTSRGGSDATFFLASPLRANWSGSLTGGANLQQRNDIDHDGWADLAGYNRGVLRPRFFWDNGKGSAALLTGGMTYEDRTGGGTISGAPYIEALNTRRYDFGGTYQFPLGERYVAASRFAASTQQHRHQFGEVVEHDRHDLLFGEVSVRGANGKHIWVAGAAVERDAYRPRDVPRFQYTYTTPGIFVQDDINIRQWLSVSASARVDFHNVYGTFFSPRVSALLRWENWTSRISAGQGFFASTPLTEETEAAGLARLSMPNPLRAERGRSASIDVTRSFGAFSATATLFGSNIRKPVYVDRGDTYRIRNLTEDTTNRGVDLVATWRKSPFAATFSYTYVRAREHPSASYTDVPLTPRHSFGIVGMWEQQDKGRFGVECYYTGTQSLEYNPYRATSKPYVLIGLMAERKLNTHVRLFINLENITNVKQTRWDSLLRPARAADGSWTVDAWAPLDGRVLNGGVRFIL